MSRMLILEVAVILNGLIQNLQFGANDVINKSLSEKKVLEVEEDVKALGENFKKLNEDILKKNRYEKLYSLALILSWI